MHLLNTLSPLKGKNRILALLSVLITFLFCLPYTKAGVSPFYSIDPDVPYVANALKIVAINQSSFVNHPGTPLQEFIGFSFWPLRIYAKLVDHTPFIKWSLVNFSFLFTYTRLVMTLWFTLGVYLFSLSAFILTSSLLSAAVGTLYILLLPHMPQSVTTINAESFMFTAFSLWAVSMSLFIKHEKARYLNICFFVSGVILGTKLTAVFLIPVSLIILASYFYKRPKLLVKYLFIACILFMLGFFGSTWPVRDKYQQIYGWAFGLATHSGLYGGGKATIFDPEVYFKTALVLVKGSMLLSVMPLISIVLIALSSHKKKKMYVALVGVVISGILAFLKYPVWYYQTINILLVGFFTSLAISMVGAKTRIFLIIMLLALIISNTTQSLANQTEMVNESTALDKYISQSSKGSIDLWEYARSKDFALLWGRDWSGDFYLNDLKSSRPNLYDIQLQDVFVVKTGSGQYTKLEKFCWDNLYVQKATLPLLLELHPKLLSLRTINIPGTSIFVIKNTQCTP